MIISNEYDSKEIEKSLACGGVGVIPTDTLYGLVGSAFSKEAIEKIYRLKKRDTSKPLIVLISYLKDLEKFGVTVDIKTKTILKENWPGPVSIILPVLSPKWDYLDCGTGSIAFRLPDHDTLRKFLSRVGPLVAPSANLEGFPPAKDIDEAKKYFGESADFYIDDGILEGKPSSLVKIEKGEIKVIRS